jgi:hypothetical protein
MSTLGLGGMFLPPPPPLDLSMDLNSGAIDLSSALVGLPPPLELPPLPALDLSAALVSNGGLDLAAALIQPNSDKAVSLPAVKENARVPLRIRPRGGLKTYDGGLGQFVKNTDALMGLNFDFSTKQCSTLGSIICRKWVRKTGLPLYKDSFALKQTVPHFNFNCLSPDDKVLRSLNRNFKK